MMDRKDAIRVIRKNTGKSYTVIVKILDETDPQLFEHFRKMTGNLLVDPLEFDPDAGPIIKRVREQAFEMIRQERGVDNIWPMAVDQLAQELLKSGHDIQWRHVLKMNPGVHIKFAKVQAESSE